MPAVRLVVVSLALAACELAPLEVPPAPQPPPEPGPGTLSGRVVVPDVTTGQPRPAHGAILRILHTSVATVANAEGRFVLTPITGDGGTLLVQYDRRDDGSFRRQRFLELAAFGTGPGRDVSAGDLSVRENATLRGRAVRGDAAEATTGHRGITVFVPQGPFTTYTGDDGSWVLPNVPEGRVSIAFFHDGYGPDSIDEIAVPAGAVLQLREVVLEKETAEVPPVLVTGRVRANPALEDLSIVMAVALAPAGETPIAIARDGSYEASLRPGLHTFRFTAEGYAPAEIRNVLVSNLVPGGLVLPDVVLATRDTEVPELEDPAITRLAPVPRLAAPPVVEVGARVVLDAGASTGMRGHALRYSWRQLAGELVTLEDDEGLDAARTAFVAPPTSQRLAFEVTVTDVDNGLADTASATLDVWTRPVALVGSPVRGATGTRFTLDASESVGPDGHVLVYGWTQVAGDPVALSVDDGPGAAAPEFVAPSLPQTLAFVVRVTDLQTGLAAEARTEIALDAAPVAEVRAPAFAEAGTRVGLDASASRGPPGHALSFSWRQLQGDVVVFEANDAPAAAGTAFLAPAASQRLAFELRVLDLVTGLEARRSFSLDVAAAPRAVLSAPPRARAGTRLALDASGSTGPAGHTLTYTWAQLAGDLVVFPEDGTGAAARVEVALPAAAQELRFSVRVTDPVTGLFDDAEAGLTTDVPPVALATATPVAARVGGSVTLDASGSLAPGGHALRYSWRQSRGDSVVLSANDAPQAVRTSFVAPARAQRLSFELTVLDEETLLAATASATVDVLEPPSARIAPVATQRTGATVRLDGSQSTAPDAGVLSYRWTQTGGAEVALSTNDSVLAAAPTFTAPATPGALAFALEVTDLQTGLADDDARTVVVASPPVAVVRPAMLVVRPNAVFELDGAASADPHGLALSHAWSTGDGGVLLVPETATAPRVRATAPAGEGTYAVRLVVSNGQLASDPVLATIEVSASATLTPTVSAGPDLAVARGATVTLHAEASSPDPTATLTYQWRQLEGPSVTLLGAASADPSFLAPPSSAILRLRVTVEASGERASDDVVVQVQDRTPPRIAARDPAAGLFGSPFSVSVTFDEPVDPTSLTPETFGVEDAAGSAVPGELRYDAATFTARFVPTDALTQGAGYTLVVGAVRDTAIVPNAHAEERFPFQARGPLWGLWRSAETQPVHPNASIAALPGGALVSGYRNDASCPGGSWVLWTQAGETLRTDPLCVPGDNAGLWSASFAPNGAPHLAVRQTGAPPRLMRLAGAEWTPLAVAPGFNLFSDGAGIFSVHSPSPFPTGDGPILSGFSGTAWSTAHQFAVGNQHGNTFAGSGQGGRMHFAFARRSIDLGVGNCEVGMFEREGGTWARIGAANTPIFHRCDFFGSAPEHHNPRVSYWRDMPLMTWLQGATSGSLYLRSLLRDRTASAWRLSTSLVVSTQGALEDYFGFDAAGGYVVYATSGRIYLRRLTGSVASPAFVDVPGPDGLALNADAGCSAEAPRLAVTDGVLWVAWAESCDGTNWGLRVRKLY